VTARSFSRAAFLASLAGAAMIAAAPPAFAARNTNAETYVQSSAAGALQALGNRSVSSASRQQTFYRLMEQFADVPRIANFVLGRYGAQLRADAALRAEWNTTFRDYAIAVYEDQLDSYSQSTLRVIGSTERVPDRDVVVISEMTPRGQNRPLRVQWRVLRAGEVWKVVDVSLILEGNEIWLAQQQQRDFLAALDRNNGDIRALMADLRRMTSTMRQRIMAGR
jgi:phospholipid transport system substrate-binding protein